MTPVESVNDQLRQILIALQVCPEVACVFMADAVVLWIEEIAFQLTCVAAIAKTATPTGTKT